MSERERMYCFHCQKNKVKNSFVTYRHTDYFPDGIIPICRPCSNKIVKKKGEEGMKFVLKMVDMPFVEKLWLEVEDENSPFGIYSRNMGLNQYSHFLDMPYQEILTDDSRKKREREQALKENEVNHITLNNGEIIEFKDEWFARYGPEYSKEEILRMEKYVKDNSELFPIDTPQKEWNLIDIAKMNVLKDQSLSERDNKAVKDWTDTILKLSKASGFFEVSESEDSFMGFESFGIMARDMERRGFVPHYPILENADDIDIMIEIMASYYKALVADDEKEINIEDKDETLDYLKPFIEKRFDLLRDKSESEDNDE